MAEELTQETFLQAYKSIDRYDGSCKVSSWLCQIGKHLYYQHYMLVSFYHVFVFILSLFQYTRDERSYDILLSVSALGVSLALAFISILKNLTSLDHLTVIRKQTIFVLIIEAIIITGLFYLINRKRTGAGQKKHN